MEVELLQRPSQSRTVQPPWEREMLSSSHVASYAGHNFRLPAPAPLPMHAAFDRAGSNSAASPHDNLQSPQSSTSLSFYDDARRRQSFSGPLPSPQERNVQQLLVRKPFFSGPLPSSNPYLSDPAVDPELLRGHSLADMQSPTIISEPFPPLKTPPPWSQLRQEKPGLTNLYPNPHLYSMATPSPDCFSPDATASPNALRSSVGSSVGLTPIGMSTNLPPVISSCFSSSGRLDTFGAQLEWRGRNASHKEVARQLFSDKQQEVFSSLHVVPNGSFSSKSNLSAMSPDHWSLAREKQKGTTGNASKASTEASSAPTQGSESSSLHLKETASSERGKGSAALITKSVPKVGKPANGGMMNRTASAKAMSRGVGGTGGAAPQTGLSRSMSEGSAMDGGKEAAASAHYTKARSLVDGVVENLVAQLVSGPPDRPNFLSDMIFSCSAAKKKRMPRTGSMEENPFSCARLLVKRISLVQLRALNPKLMELASSREAFEGQRWAWRRGGRRESCSNEGLRLLHLQEAFVELGLETFDALCKLRDHFPHVSADQEAAAGGGRGRGSISADHLRVASIGGGPGCSALALHLFFLRLFPSLHVQVDMCAGEEQWKETVDALSMKAIGFVSMDLQDLIRHPSLLRSYKLIAFTNILSEKMKMKMETKTEGRRWQDDFWIELYQNTNAMVAIIVHESGCRWEEIGPARGGPWWFSSIPDDETVHIVRKV